MDKLKFGMIGGAEGSFIADVHRRAAEFDGMGELAAGCFSRSYEKSLAFGRKNGIAEDRIYGSFEEMAAAEGRRRDPVDFVIVAAPNHVHYDCCRAFLQQGIHVVCDKPLTTDSRQALELKELAEKQHLLFAVTYPYASMPAAAFLRQKIREGLIGDILHIRGEYLSDNLLAPNEALDSGMLWRIDPAKAGQSTCCADIGVHAQNLISYVTGLKMQKISADMNVYGADRVLDTDFTAMVQYENGVKGHLWCSNVAAGKYNDLNIAVFGTKGSLSWSLEDPDIVTFGGDPGQTVLYRMGKNPAAGSLSEVFRLPAGQGEGYYLAFANIYRNFMKALQARADGQPADGQPADGQPEAGQPTDGQPIPAAYPTIDEGIESLRFVEACIASSRAGGAWTEL